MLELKNITKDYKVSSGVTHAVKGISLNFRRSEFVSILGPSGGGKTTLLNIIGGLDQYTSGDLIIEGKSTKEYKSRDWDAYRNHSIGFVFQSYNLIMHQTVVANVEMALTISGLTGKKRREYAEKALIEVGLEKEINKMPNQLSGGQMQRVAIARALVNNPEVILADEPTGALDSKTSVQIMELIKRIAENRLVIVVTHNADLAYQYSTRIIELHDGLITSDSNPYSDEDSRKDFEAEKAKLKKEQDDKIAHFKKIAKDDKEFNKLVKASKKEERRRLGRVKMSFFTALNLSLKNLWTKKGRTFLVSFAGSIGIIGIALVLAISNGFNNYVNQVQGDTLSQYPLTINRSAFAMEDIIMPNMEGNIQNDKYPGPDSDGNYEVTQNGFFSGFVKNMSKTGGENDLKTFKTRWLEDPEVMKKYNDNIMGIQYVYDTDFMFYHYDETKNEYVKNFPVDYAKKLSGRVPAELEKAGVFNMLSMFDVCIELLDNEAVLKDQFDLIAGDYPVSPYQGVIILDRYNRIADYVLYALGLRSPEDLIKILNGETIEPFKFKTDELLNLKYKMPLTADYFVKPDVAEGQPPVGYYYDQKDETDAVMKEKLKNDPSIPEFEIVGIIRPRKDATTTFATGGVGYLRSLSDELIKRVEEHKVVQDILDPNHEYCLYDLAMVDLKSLGIALPSIEPGKPCMKWSAIESIVQSAGYNFKRADLQDMLIKPALHVCDKSFPNSIRIYPKSFEDKDKVVQMIDEYNAFINKEYESTPEIAERKQITYADSVGAMMSSMTTIIDSITYVLIAFVSVSLVVSSIMIGIITYVSVIERTKEIGILRSLGASKYDVSNIFNAETLLIGLGAGLLGVGIAFILTIPINLIIAHLTGIGSIANLGFIPALILIAISTLLTMIAGLFPSRIAAQRDPVIALRSGD